MRDRHWLNEIVHEKQVLRCYRTGPRRRGQSKPDDNTKGVMAVNTSRGHVQGIGSRIKVVAAAVGAIVMITMAVLTAAIGGNEAHADVTVGGAGSTSTQDRPPTLPPIPSAAPTMKAPHFVGNAGMQ